MGGCAAGAGTGLAGSCLRGSAFGAAGGCSSTWAFAFTASTGLRCGCFSAAWPSKGVGPNQARWAPARSLANPAHKAETWVRRSPVWRTKSLRKATLRWRKATISSRSRIVVSVNTPTFVLPFHSHPMHRCFCQFAPDFQTPAAAASLQPAGSATLAGPALRRGAVPGISRSKGAAARSRN